MWYSQQGNVITLTLHIQPGVKLSAVSGLHGDALKIRLAAPPTEGRANAALLRLIADCFNVPLRQVELKHGTQSRRKTVVVRDSTVAPENLLLLADSSSLSDLKEIGCKSAWPVHISPLFWSIE